MHGVFGAQTLQNPQDCRDPEWLAQEEHLLDQEPNTGAPPSLQNFFKFQGVGSGSRDRLNDSSLGDETQTQQQRTQGQGNIDGNGPSKGNARRLQHSESAGAVAAVQTPGDWVRDHCSSTDPLPARQGH